MSPESRPSPEARRLAGTRGARGLFFDHSAAPLTALDSGPLAGLRHRTVIEREHGSTALALWQEEHESGFAVPLHAHDCEELITVLTGEVRAEVAGEFFRVAAGQSILIPAWSMHGFTVTSPSAVRLLAIFAASAPRIFGRGGEESIPPWRGGPSDHLELRGRYPAMEAVSSRRMAPPAEPSSAPGPGA